MRTTPATEKRRERSSPSLSRMRSSLSHAEGSAKGENGASDVDSWLISTFLVAFHPLPILFARRRAATTPKGGRGRTTPEDIEVA